MFHNIKEASSLMATAYFVFPVCTNRTPIKFHHYLSHSTTTYRSPERLYYPSKMKFLFVALTMLALRVAAAPALPPVAVESTEIEETADKRSPSNWCVEAGESCF